MDTPTDARRGLAGFMDLVETLRWDDHRYYHQSRINQVLHLVSAISFLVAYAMLPFDPAISGLIGWCVGMVTRQSGHIFFEPRGYDRINEASYEHKESIKVGFNMRRKAVIIGLWLALPLLLWAQPTLFGLLPARAGYLHNLGLTWLCLGAAGLAFRTIHLFFIRSPIVGLAWATKIVTDPLHNVDIYWRSPLALMRGELYDPLEEA